MSQFYSLIKKECLEYQGTLVKAPLFLGLLVITVALLSWWRVGGELAPILFENSSNSPWSISESLIVTGFPYLHDKKWAASFSIFKDFYSKTQGVRRLGAAALDLCFVAMGRFEVFYEFNLKPWDICAGSIIAEEAGALVTDWNGSKYPESGKRILASNRHVHKEALNVLKTNSAIFFN